MRYLRALILSLIIHLGLAAALSLYLPETPVKARDVSVVELLETPELPRRPQQSSFTKKQFVRSAPVPNELLTPEKREARFSSEHDQYVIEERKARDTGLTANRSVEGGNDFESFSSKPSRSRSASRGKLDLNPSRPLERQDELQRNIAQGLGDVEVGGLSPRDPNRTPQLAPDGSRPLPLPNFMGAEKGTSTIGEALPSDIQFGDFTALNTDRHTYYTFYSRMEEMVRHRWVTYAKAVLYNFDSRPNDLNGKETWTTRLEIVLDREGKFVKAVLHESSGLRALDSAPVQAFKDVQQFPNPPVGMISEDGTIHIEYAFNVNIVSHLAKGE